VIVDLPDTTTRDINRRLVDERDEGGAVALGRVLTLVIVVGQHDPEEAIAAANEASREHPCRIIVLSTIDGRSDAHLAAQIRLGGDAGASEVIVLWPSGELRDHLDSLVTPLLLPDAPIVVWWPFDVPDDPAHDPVGRMGRRRITDTTQCATPPKTLRALARVYTAGDTDLAWTRATLWRGLIAATLDQPPYESVHRAVVTGEATHPSMDLMAAWLAWALKCPVEIVRIPDAPAITSVRLERASGDIVLDRPDGKTAELHRPGAPPQRIALPIRQLKECLVEELRRLDPDEVYGEVLTKGLAKVAQ